MKKRFIEHIERKFEFLKGKKLLLACSGGVDSVVLADLCAHANLSFALAHCNFSLRGKESDTDEIFVVGYAKKMGVPAFAEKFKTREYAEKKGISIQMAARELRYTWFEKLLADFNYDFVLTAHHLDDDLETFFINLTRGSGLDGLTGIPEQNERVVRPLLPFLKEEILAYANRKNLIWREDRSNLETEYIRNRLRQELIPELKKISPELIGNFPKTKQYLRDARALISDYLVLVQNLLITEENDSLKVDLLKLRELPNPEALLYELLKDYGFQQWDSVFDLAEAQSGKQVFSKTHRLLKDRDFLILTDLPPAEKDLIYEVPRTGIDYPVQLIIEEVASPESFSSESIYVPAEKIKFPLRIRKWKKGDSFQPFGMKGRKKLSKFFKDEKFSLIEKEEVWLLVNQDEIVWIIGHRMDENYRVTRETRKILKISAEDKS